LRGFVITHEAGIYFPATPAGAFVSVIPASWAADLSRGRITARAFDASGAGTWEGLDAHPIYQATIQKTIPGCGRVLPFVRIA
jgi:hypothetical protein